MCFYITLVAPTSDHAAVRAVMHRHQRAAMLFDNTSVARMLLPGEKQYLTTQECCDCRSVLVPEDEAACDDCEAEIAREIAEARRKGWSPARGDRAIDDTVQVRERIRGRKSREATDSFELWASIIDDLRRELSLPYVGLLVHAYNGRVDDEEFRVTRRTAPLRCPLVVQLESLRPDELTIFPNN